MVCVEERTLNAVLVVFLFLSEYRFIQFCANVGNDSNNRAKLLVLCSLLWLALSRRITRLKVFGDSIMVNKWMCDEKVILGLSLQELLGHLETVSSKFIKIYFTHIFRG